MFEVQQFTICSGWVNDWHEWDDNNESMPMVFDTYGEALDELDNFLNDCQKEYERGNISAPYYRNEFRIVEVKQ